VLRVAEHFSDSDLGRQRQGNEDSLFVRSPVFVVADGMGGAQAGEVASRMAVDAFDGGLRGGAPAQELRELITAANERIHASSRADERRAGMGTTITAAYVGEEDVTIAHVGDSRAYLLRRGQLTRLTRDHTLVEELIARGKLTEEQAETHPQRSVITRSVGPEPGVEVDTDTFPARADDVFLICSDGLTSMVPEARVLEILRGAGSLREAGRRLIAAANDAGGRDNITVVLFRLESVEPGRGGVGEQPTQVGEGAPAAAAVRAAVREADAGAGARTEPRGEGAVAVADREPAAATPPPGRPVGPPPAPARRRRRRLPPVAIILFLIAIPVISGVLLTLRAVYFIGTDPRDGRTITVFRGLPYELPGGVRLYTRYGGSGVTIDAVPPSRRATFTDHKLRTRDDATGLVDELELGRLTP
jgi:protein phosphatase